MKNNVHFSNDNIIFSSSLVMLVSSEFLFTDMIMQFLSLYHVNLQTPVIDPDRISRTISIQHQADK